MLVYNLMKLNACSLLALFDCRILEEITEKIFWRGKNVMTCKQGMRNMTLIEKSGKFQLSVGRSLVPL